MQASRTLRGSGIALAVLVAACSSASGRATSADASSRGDGAATDGSAHATHDASPRDAKRRDAPPADAGADGIAQPTDAGEDVAEDVAFVPAAQAFPITPSNSAEIQLFRVVMPYDYVVLASIVLKGQGYTPRLILVNMPALVHDDACYVNEATSFIDYNWTNAVLQLKSSRPSIRQIANTLANSLNLGWTTASEFTYSNGLGQVLATVVETEPPSSDPVAGQNPPSQPMVIDF